MRILFLVPYPLQKSPSQRFRFEQYFDELSKSQISYSVKPFVNAEDYSAIFGPGNAVRKGWILIKGFVKRLTVLVTVHKFDFFFIHREATPIGPPLIEFFITRIFRKRIIYDFDDAIWLTDRQSENVLIRSLRWRSKVGKICRWAYKVSAGNKYLAEYARQFNDMVVVNPTTIETRAIGPSPAIDDKFITIGWTGSHSTLKYLYMIDDVLARIELKYPQVDFLVIADHQPELKLRRLKFKRWNLQTEIDDLRMITIGIMPLPDDPWTQGKCGFKIIQYMALAIPAVASPVGVNKDIIKSGVNGFLCARSEEWFQALELLINQKQLRRELGEKGRQLVDRRYSTSANSSNFIALFT